ncbi:MAG: hypothetical protein AB7S38_16630 [Vulcanimicrobiota bacterium]
MRIAGRQKIDVEVTYDRPVTRRTKLGNIPYDYHSYSSHRDRYFTSCDQGACEGRGREVWRDLPVYGSDGKVAMETVTERIVASPDSALWAGVRWGLIGVAGGALVGTIAAAVTNSPLGLGASLGAAAGGALGGGLGANHAMGDRVRLEWQEKPVLERELAGYYHEVDSRYTTRCDRDWDGHYRCRQVHDGYDHEFRPEVSGHSVGSYTAPVVVHYRED